MAKMLDGHGDMLIYGFELRLRGSTDVPVGGLFMISRAVVGRVRLG